jgi:hypothetical protein
MSFPALAGWFGLWRAYKILYKISDVKPVEFCGSALSDLKGFPGKARCEAGRQLRRVQHGLDPHDWKLMTPVGPSTREIRIHDQHGAFRDSMWRAFAMPFTCCTVSGRKRKRRRLPTFRLPGSVTAQR